MSVPDASFVVASGPLAGAEVVPRHARRLRLLARLAAAAVAALGAAALAGWALALPRPPGELFGPSRPMPDSAFALVLAGVAVAAAAGESTIGRRRLVLASASAVAVIGAAALLGDATGFDLGLGALAAALAAGEPAGALLRMRPETGVALLFLGAALALVGLVGANGRQPRRQLFAQAALALVGAVGLAHVVAFAHGVPSFFDPAERMAMPFETALGLCLAALGAVAALPESGAARLLAARGPGGEVARRMLPLVLLVPPALILLRLQLVAAGLVAEKYGLASTAVLFVAAGVALVLWSARRLTLQDVVRRRAEAALRGLFDHAVLGIWRTSSTGRVLAANPKMVRMLGYDSEAELLAVDLLAKLYRDPGERSKVVERFRAQGQNEGIEVEYLRRDGTPITVRATGRVVPTERGEEYEVFAEDVTERRALEEQLRRSQRLESLGRLAAGVAHDFNNFLGVIVGYAGLLRDRLDEPALRGWADEIAFAAERAAGVTRQLLAFGKQQAVRAQPLDLRHVVEESGALLRRLIGEEIELEVRLPAALDRVHVDRVQLEQVIVNLAVNARDAMPAGGRLTITAEFIDRDEETLGGGFELSAGRYVRLQVSDTGCGMDPETLQHIFEPFFTTKGAGRGTGLGLATVYGIVRQNGGGITVSSEPGEGTVFRIDLPSCESGAPDERVATEATEAAEAARRRAAPGATGGGATVLVVEDEEALRKLTATLLRKAGYEVLEAPDGATARQLAAGRSLRLLVTDVMLRGERGPDLAAQLAVELPELAVLYVSGYADRQQFRGRALGPRERFLPKPFQGAELRRAVRALLDGEEEEPGRPSREEPAR